MTPQMISKARKNAEEGKYFNVDFRLGEIENLPVADSSVDVIISNCVINLSPEKQRVFNEAFRVLKQGGRLAVSDVVLTADMPDEMKTNMDFYSACVSGASSIKEINRMLLNAGFSDIQIEPKDESRKFIRNWIPGSNAADYLVSASIKAKK